MNSKGNTIHAFHDYVGLRVVKVLVVRCPLRIVVAHDAKSAMHFTIIFSFPENCERAMIESTCLKSTRDSVALRFWLSTPLKNSDQSRNIEIDRCPTKRGQFAQA